MKWSHCTEYIIKCNQDDINKIIHHPFRKQIYVQCKILSDDSYFFIEKICSSELNIYKYCMEHLYSISCFIYVKSLTYIICRFTCNMIGGYECMEHSIHRNIY